MNQRIKKKLILIAENFSKILWVFPINENRVTFISYDGSQYSDNPKYISELMKDKERIWVLEEQKMELCPQSCNVIKKGTFKSIIYLFTSKAIVTNNFLPTWFPKRNRQIILNTWHGGSPLKTVGLKDACCSDYDIWFFKHQARKYSAFLSSSKFMDEEVFRNSFSYFGELVRTGMPRNALLIQNDPIKKQEIKRRLNIPLSKKILLYAPTFRGGFKEGFFLSTDKQLDLSMVLQELNQTTEYGYLGLFRAHHSMINNSPNYLDVMNVSDYPDMQELLLITDILITDYSSCMGDIALAGKPVFLYAPDLDQYKGDRGFYWPIEKLPFPLAKTTHEMVKNIQTFSEIDYKENLKSYFNDLGTYENINSDRLAVDWLESKML